MIAVQDQVVVARVVEGLGAVMLALDKWHAVCTTVVVTHSGTELQRAHHREAFPAWDGCPQRDSEVPEKY